MRREVWSVQGNVNIMIMKKYRWIARKLANIEKKIKEESPYLASPVVGWGLVWVAWSWRWPPRCAVAENPAGARFDGLEVNFWWLFELYLVRLVHWWLLRFLRWLLRWLFLGIVACSVMVARSSVVVSFTGWQHVFPGPVVRLPCRHSYIELSAKYARRNIDHVQLLAYPCGWAIFVVTDIVGLSVMESREISNRSSSRIDKTGWTIVLG